MERYNNIEEKQTIKGMISELEFNNKRSCPYSRCSDQIRLWDMDALLLKADKSERLIEIMIQIC